MIPKIIHYCWFGRNPKPELAIRCMKSWKKYCPTYKIIEWNEDNFDISAAPLYVQQAYEAKKWAFVTDYVRLQVVYEYGGIYLDTDVELLKKPNQLQKYHAFFAFEEKTCIATGLGFGAEQRSQIIAEMLNDYSDISFIKENGDFDLTPCPIRNTPVLLRHGLKGDGTFQVLTGNICVLPTEYMCPLDNCTGILRKTKKTISIHWFNASWVDEEERKVLLEVRKIKREYIRRDFWIHMPNRIAMKLLGMERYERLKKLVKDKKGNGG